MRQLLLAMGWLLAVCPALQAQALDSLQNKAMLTNARTIYIAMFNYSCDHNGAYPTGKSSTEVFQKLLDEGYCSDPTLFYFSMEDKIKPESSKLKPENVCWDVTGQVVHEDSDLLPVVFTTGYRMKYVAGVSVGRLKSGSPVLGGMNICYKGNNVLFRKETDGADPVVMLAIDKNFDAKGKTFQQLTPDGPLPPP